MSNTSKYEAIKELLSDKDEQKVANFVSYIYELETKKKKDRGGSWVIANPWASKITAKAYAQRFNRVDAEGLAFDGKHITMDTRGINYDYVAYKNKMLLAYPETEINFAAVFKGDEFEFRTGDFKVHYSHKIINPFNKNTDDIIGAYCVIKNKRGEFLTTLDANEIKKHRAVAKTDAIWKKWFIEMVYKTVIKKACKYHFDDMFTNIDAEDNEQYDLDNPLELSQEHKEAIEAIESLEDLKAYYLKHKADAGVSKYVSKRKGQINESA